MMYDLNLSMIRCTSPRIECMAFVKRRKPWIAYMRVGEIEWVAYQIPAGARSDLKRKEEVRA